MQLGESNNSLDLSRGSVIRVISDPNLQREAEKSARDKNFRVFRVNAEGINSKDSLFTTIADALCFPEYFGRNWDALEECLRDQSWQDDKGVLVIFESADNLLAVDPQDLATLINVLLIRLSSGGKKE